MPVRKWVDPLNRAAVKALRGMGLAPLQYDPEKAPALVLLEETLDRWSAEVESGVLDQLEDVVYLDLQRVAPGNLARYLGQPPLPLMEMEPKEVGLAVLDQLNGRLAEERESYPERTSLPGETRLDV
jgi:hypothetical protein